VTPLGQPISASAPPAPVTDERLHVLVIEDDSGARGALRMLLELRGYAVAEAADGVRGVAHALAHRPAIAVIDIGLPGLDGYAVARRIREGLAGSPMFLIALTGYHNLDERPGQTGFDAHLVKPLKLDQLFEHLERVAGERARPA
jgi:two-component system, sensor histidine kinase